MNTLNLYHGTSAVNARHIQKEGFRTDIKSNWPVKSKLGFIYFSTAYAPFYAMKATKRYRMALIKVHINEDKLFPEDDFIMTCCKGLPVYKQSDIDNINLCSFRHLWRESIDVMGTVAAYPEDITIEGITEFDGRNLLSICDPSISPTNYQLLGTYYRYLSDWLYKGGKVLDFRNSIQESILKDRV